MLSSSLRMKRYLMSNLCLIHTEFCLFNLLIDHPTKSLFPFTVQNKLYSRLREKKTKEKKAAGMNGSRVRSAINIVCFEHFC